MNKKYKVSFIGSGNVGHHLAIGLYEAGHIVEDIYSRNIANTYYTASITGAKSINKIEDITYNSDIYIIAINDDSIISIANQLPISNKIILHTSASVKCKIETKNKNEFGVIYPLQSFTKSIPVDLKNTPFLIDAENDRVKSVITDILSGISLKIFEANDDKRIAIHVAAVFTNNFTNHMLALAEMIITKEGFNREILLPLFEQTFLKLKLKSAVEVQTGPAVRGDYSTIIKHEDFLKNDIATKELYHLINKSIQSIKR